MIFLRHVARASCVSAPAPPSSRCYTYQPWRLGKPLLTTRGQECTLCSVAQVAQSVEPVHRVSVLPSWLFLARSWTYIYILCIYMPAALVKVGSAAPLALPSYLRCLDRTRQTSSSFLGADRPCVRGLVLSSELITHNFWCPLCASDVHTSPELDTTARSPPIPTPSPGNRGEGAGAQGWARRVRASTGLGLKFIY